VLGLFGGHEYVDNGQIVTSHEYSVQRVDLGAHPPTVTLLNPWGATNQAPQEVTLTEDQWHQYFNEVSYTGTRV
jgi:hypothetical protein